MAPAPESVFQIPKGNAKSPLYSALPLSVLMVGVEQLLQKGFSCPCKPVLNQLLTAFIFITPALLAFTAMLFIMRPCQRRGSPRQLCPKTVLPCLIPPVAWVLLLLLDGKYLACGLTFGEGRFVSDGGDPPVKWCDDSSFQETEEKQLQELIGEWSQVAGFVGLSAVFVVVMCAIGFMDCRQAKEEDALEHPHTVPADGAVGVEVEGHQAFWTCDDKPSISVLTTVPPHTDSLGVSTKTKAGLVTEDDPLPF
ncbi:hypothetical protein NFI96_021398 [Prochilodus magdalenae]|nr:hypothetical protein NFI96_021398 [Prochilodus magdalenae]